MLCNGNIRDGKVDEFAWANHSIVLHKAGKKIVLVRPIEIALQLLYLVCRKRVALLRLLAQFLYLAAWVLTQIPLANHPSTESGEPDEIIVARPCRAFTVDENVVEKISYKQTVYLIAVFQRNAILFHPVCEDAEVRQITVRSLLLHRAFLSGALAIRLVLLEALRKRRVLPQSSGLHPNIPAGAQAVGQHGNKFRCPCLALLGCLQPVKIIFLAPHGIRHGVVAIEVHVGTFFRLVKLRERVGDKFINAPRAAVRVGIHFF